MPPLTPLLRPDRFFAERDHDGRRVLAVVAAVTLVALGVFYGIGWIVTINVDGTVMVDNPDRPPDFVCDDDSDVLDQSGCDQPRLIEQNVDSQIWAAWHNSAAKLVIGIPLAWLVLGGLLHVGSALLGGKNGVFSSFAVAAWGLPPTLVSGIVITGVLIVTVDPITVTPTSQDKALRTLQDPFRAVETIRVILTVVAAAWSGIIWRFGLKYERRVNGPAAWVVAGSVAALMAVLALL